ncbi:hypothetical protein [Thioclava sp. GXIMD4215]|uniref:hypothetical protein n=1 Tax=Thioclava sp. GXIMD4215 TaxID=3131928 RepID=UPI003245FFB9
MFRQTFRMKAILLFVATLAFVLSPLWSPSFKGYDPSMFPNPVDKPAVQPAGWAFSIWSLIYLWLVIHAAWGLFKRAEVSGWDQPRWPLFLSLALGASWLVVATSQPWLATLQIWIMWAAAVWAMARAPRTLESALLSWPISLYAGWLTAASAVGTGVVLIGYNIGSETVVTLLMLSLVAAISLTLILWLRPPRGYALGVIWALIGVIAANWGHDVIMLPACIYALALLVLTFWQPRSPRHGYSH